MKILGKLFATVAVALAVTAGAQAEGDAIAGKKVFNKCRACHSFDAKKKIGPTLAGVMGRKAGTVEGYRYSKAFQASDVVWDEASIGAYLAAPRKYIKGTKMAFAGLRKPADIANIIAFLKTNGQ